MTADDRIVVTLRDISEAAGISVDGARARAKRRAKEGRWRILPTNHPQDPLRIEMPQEDLDVGSMRPLTGPNGSHPTANEKGSSRSEDAAQGNEEDNNSSHEAPNVVAVLQARIDDLINRCDRAEDRADKLANELSSLATRLADTERQKGEVEKQAALSAAEVGHLQARIEAEMKAHREELERHRKMASSELDRVRMEGEREAAEMQSIIDEWRARPWWRRLLG